MLESMESTERYRISRNFAMLPSNEHQWNNSTRSKEVSPKPDPDPAEGSVFKIRT